MVLTDATFPQLDSPSMSLNVLDVMKSGARVRLVYFARAVTAFVSICACGEFKVIFTRIFKNSIPLT